MGNHLIHNLLDPGFINVFLAILASGLLLVGLFLGLTQLPARHPDDGQIVFKTIMQFFKSLGILTLLAGLSLLAVELWVDGARIESFTTNLRDSLALLLGGTIFALFHGSMLKRGVTDDSLISVRSFYLGWRLAVHGFVVFGALVVLCLLFLQRDPSPWPERVHLRRMQVGCFGVLFTWGVSWVVHVVLLWWNARSRPVPASGATWESKD